MSNPHLRAGLGDILEAILPIEEEEDDDDQRRRRFNNDRVMINAVENFDNVKDLYRSVLQVYSDIEFTGL